MLRVCTSRSVHSPARFVLLLSELVRRRRSRPRGSPGVCALRIFEKQKAPLDSAVLFAENPCPFAQSAGTSSGDSGLHQSSSTIIRIVVVRITSRLSKRVDRNSDRTNNAAEHLKRKDSRTSCDEIPHSRSCLTFLNIAAIQRYVISDTPRSLANQQGMTSLQAQTEIAKKPRQQKAPSEEGAFRFS